MTDTLANHAASAAEPRSAQRFGARIPLLGAGSMSPEQREVFEQVVSGPRGRLIGPLRAALHNPALADRWQKLGQVLRYETSLPRHLSELAIIVVARHWSSRLEWAIHVVEAREAGLDERVIDAVRRRAPPSVAPDAEAEIYEFSRQLLADGQVDQAAYDAVLDRWGVVGVVELTALVGYYSMVAMTLNAHAIPLPEGEPSDLEPFPVAALPRTDAQPRLK